MKIGKVFLQNYTEFIDIAVDIDTRVQEEIGRSKHAQLITSTRRRA